MTRRNNRCPTHRTKICWLSRSTMKIDRLLESDLMRKHRTYIYKECGLDDVVLLNGFTIDESGSLFINDIHGLHKVIVESRIFAPRKLKGKEIRFMRHYLDWSQKCLGEALGVDYQSVHRWETGKTKITKTADRLLRGLAYEYINGNARMIDLIRKISDLDNNRVTTKLELSHNKDGWAKAA